MDGFTREFPASRQELVHMRGVLGDCHSNLSYYVQQELPFLERTATLHREISFRRISTNSGPLSRTTKFTRAFFSNCGLERAQV